MRHVGYFSINSALLNKRTFLLSAMSSGHGAFLLTRYQWPVDQLQLRSHLGLEVGRLGSMLDSRKSREHYLF